MIIQSGDRSILDCECEKNRTNHRERDLANAATAHESRQSSENQNGDGQGYLPKLPVRVEEDGLPSKGAARILATT